MSAGTAELLRIAREAAVEAGELAARLRREGVEGGGDEVVPDRHRHRGGPGDRGPDPRSPRAAGRPEDGFLGEESGGAGGGTSGLTWVVDPIDGTVNYLYGLPNWSVSIAVVEGDPDPAHLDGARRSRRRSRPRRDSTGASAGGGAHP